jgi:hypothetical protein
MSQVFSKVVPNNFFRLDMSVSLKNMKIHVTNRSLIPLKPSKIAVLNILYRCMHNIQGWNMQSARISVISPVN